MNALEKLGFKIYDVSETSVTYHKKEEYSDNTYDGLRVEINFKDNSISFIEVSGGDYNISQTPLDVIEASIDVLNSRKIEVTF